MNEIKQPLEYSHRGLPQINYLQKEINPPAPTRRLWQSYNMQNMSDMGCLQVLIRTIISFCFLLEAYNPVYSIPDTLYGVNIPPRNDHLHQAQNNI